MILQCTQVGEVTNKASIEIDLVEKWVKLDSENARLQRESLNQAMLKKYNESLKVDDKIGILFWAPQAYTPSKFNIQTMDGREVIATPEFPIKGTLNINRNTLFVTVRESMGGLLNEQSFSCKRVESGF